MDDLLARTRCFKCGELGHLAKECPQNKETTTNSENFFSGMVYINSCDVHPRNRFWADRCRDNSCAGAVRSNCTGFLKTILPVFLEVVLLVFLEMIVLVFLEMIVLVFLEMMLVHATLETNPVLLMTLETNLRCTLILETVGVLKLNFNKMM